MSLWTPEEIATANRIWKDDPVGRENFLNDLLKKNRQDREALMKRYNKGFWRHLWEIFLIGADNVGAEVTGQPLPGLVGGLSDAYKLECLLRNDIAAAKASLSLGIKAVVLVGGIILIKKL